ncbi:MAG: DUF4389 domain-containing protein [Pseudomonadales bacterium]|jgi:hypothetical protein|nr:DUF4389 domain-containing protein [Pseudomonadales bacterium]
MSEDTRTQIGDRKLWERVLYMLFCAIAYGIAEFVVALVAIFQVVRVLLTGSIDERVHRLGRNVGAYIFELLQFATFNSERVPFPFSDWPDEEPGASPWQRTTKSAPEAARSASPTSDLPERAASGRDGDPSETDDSDPGASSR